MRSRLAAARLWRSIALGSMLCVSAAAPGALADAAGTTSGSAGNWDIGLKASTPGVGVEVRRSLSESFALRGVVNSYSYAVNEGVDDVDYHRELNPDATPSGGAFEFDRKTHMAAELGSAHGDADFKPVSPYLGIGFDRDFGSESQFGVALDVGVLLQGEPQFKLDVTCGAAVPALRCAQLADDVEAERRQFEDDARKLAFYPVLSLGFTFRLGGD